MTFHKQSDSTHLVGNSDILVLDGLILNGLVLDGLVFDGMVICILFGIVPHGG